MITILPVSFAVILEAPSAKELLKEYSEECSIQAIGPINPQAAIYEALEQNGAMQCFGAFDGVQIVGFASVLMTVLPHYGKKVATVESLFVPAEYRHSAAGTYLLRAIDEQAKESGCVGVLYSAPTGGRLERLLDIKGAFQRTNAIFYRSLS